MNDLDDVVAGERVRAMLPSGNNRAVHLHRDGPLGEAHVLE